MDSPVSSFVMTTGDALEPSESWQDYKDKTELPEELLAKVESFVDLVNL